jgi:IgGFc binding protein
VALAKAGDVALLAGDKGEQVDLSGSLVQADKPVQVLSGIPCVNIPGSVPSCDHVEETVLPAEALGKSYVVSAPTKPAGGIGQHVVRFYGNQNATVLTYPGGTPTGCPTTLNAGEVVTCGPLGKDFYVEANKEFGVASFMVGASVYDMFGTNQQGDPSQTVFPATEQYRKKYLFLAPDDYNVSYAVVSGPLDAAPIIDGIALTGIQFVGTGFGVWRATLGNLAKGSHTLTAAKPVALQVMGYGDSTSYQYPGGMNLTRIAAPPPAP